MRRSSLLVVPALLTLLGLAPPAQAGSAAPSALPASMAAAGDSITKAYDATLFGCFLADCPQYSWSTGTSSAVRSQLTRIRAAQPGVAVSAVNVARTGAKMAELDAQLSSVAAGVQYATVLMGANDVCTSSVGAMTPTSTFRTSFDTALGHFFGSHPGAYVSVSSIPNIYKLWSVLQTSTSARNTWRTFGICQSMLAAGNTEATRQTVLAREIEFNSALAQICSAYDRCRWDGGATFDVTFLRSDVSTLDYFHPSVSGQAKLAAVSWGASYWPAR